MKKNFTLYDRATGMFKPSHYFGNPALHETEELAHMVGHFDALSQKVDLSDKEKPAIVDHQPPQPSAEHEWDGKTKRWVPNAAMRAHHEARLAAQTRIADLVAPERALIRRLLLDPSDADARRALTAIDDELRQLSKLSDLSASGESSSSQSDAASALA